MTKEQFIKKMQDRGYVFSLDKYLDKDLRTYMINNDNTVSLGHPGGIFKYNSFQDAFEGINVVVIERYKV